MGAIGSTCTASPCAVARGAWPAGSGGRRWRVPRRAGSGRGAPSIRGLHSSTFQLNLSRF